jgi:CRISPR-associated protein Csd1
MGQSGGRVILQSLRDLAVREGLVDDPAFESKPVRWVIRLKRDGTFVGVYDTNQTPLAVEGKKGKPRPEALMMLIPRRRGRTVNIAADFLVDKAEYALGLMPGGELAAGKTLQRKEDFVAMLQQAHDATSSSPLISALTFLGDASACAQCACKLAEQGDFATNDLFAFEVDGEYLQDVEELRKWWAERAGIAHEISGQEQQCLMCGRDGAVVEKHNLIQIRGGVTSGVPLVSFNSDAFEKYGWQSSRNAPICNECMTAYVEGLRRLTKPRYVLPRTGLTVGPLSTSLTDDTTAVYWADTDSELVSALPFLRDDPKKVRDVLLSPHKGVRVSVGAADRFYCLILSGAQGRAVVRKIHTGTVSDVEANLRRYFAAIDVERFDRSAPLPLYRLLQSMVLQGKLDRLPPELGSELWLASVFGQPLSRLFLATLIARNRAERAVPAERAALLQFYFESKNRLGKMYAAGAEYDKKEVSLMSVNPEDKVAYLLGSLLAVLENLQTAAQGRDLNRTIVDRFYGAASTRPGVVFPQLLKLAQHHLSKASKKVGRKADDLNEELGEILSGIKLGELNTTLDLEQQGNFALGYYHRRQRFYKKRETAPPDAGQINETSTEENGESNA